MSVKVCLSLKLLGLEAATNRARFGAGVMASASAQDALKDARAFASDGMCAFALVVMGVSQMAAAAFETGNESRRFLTGASGVTNVVAATALAEDGGIAGDVHAAVGAKHADPMAAEEGCEGSVAVEQDNRDGGIGEGVETFGAEQPLREQAELRVREAGVEANLREQGLLRIEGAVSIPSRDAAELNVNPLLAGDDVAFPQHICEVLFVGEGIRQGNLAGDSEREIARGNGGPILDRAAGPSAFDEVKGQGSNGTFDGSVDAHDDLHG